MQLVSDMHACGFAMDKSDDIYMIFHRTKYEPVGAVIVENLAMQYISLADGDLELEYYSGQAEAIFNARMRLVF